MISSKKLVILFNTKYHTFQSEVKRKINIEEILLLLNQAQLTYFVNRVKNTELNDQVENALSYFEEKEKEWPLVKSFDKYDIYKKPVDCYKVLRRKIIASKKGCGEKEIRVTNVQTDDLNYALVSPLYKPSFSWEISIGNEGSEGYFVWHSGDHEIKKFIADWYRLPKEFHCPSMHPNGEYEDWNGNKITNDVNCELNDVDSELIVDIALITALGIDGESINPKANEIILKEKI